MYVMTVREVCERALRKVGAFALDETGADPSKMDETRYWLDMVVGEAAADKRTFWLIDKPYHLELKKGQQSYSLLDDLYPDPVNGIMFPVDARLQTHEPPEAVPAQRDYTDLSAPITPSVTMPLLRRVEEWDKIPDKEREGEPQQAYITRTDTPDLLVHFIPNQDMRWSIDLVVQEYTPDFVSANPTKKIDMIRRTWNKWLVLALAAEIGTGPVARLPLDESRELEKQRERAWDVLFSYESQEHANEPRRTKYHGSI